MSKAEALFHRIANTLPEVKKSKMFGAQCYKAPNGKALAMYWQDTMVFKLTGDAEHDALSLDGAQYFNPMGERPMTGWVQVPFHYAERWPEFASKALDYVKTLR